MRRIRIASAKNPDIDFIELNDFNGFLCTQFQTLGISREVEFLTIKNRNIPVDNKPVFKKYRLTIEILTPYSQYEAQYYSFMNFLDRNKKDGLRLYYKPYDNVNERYCLCSIESSTKIEKRQPIILNLTQNSLWLGEVKSAYSSLQDEAQGNLFVFDANESKNDFYYSAKFYRDETVTDAEYHCVSFYYGALQKTDFEITGYNEVPLNFIINGKCLNPELHIYRGNETTPIRKFQVFTTIDKGYHLQVNSGILENGVWAVNNETGEKFDLTSLVNYEYGSPYIYLDNGLYRAEIRDGSENENRFDAVLSWQEEYSD